MKARWAPIRYLPAVPLPIAGPGKYVPAAFVPAAIIAFADPGRRANVAMAPPAPRDTGSKPGLVRRQAAALPNGACMTALAKATMKENAPMTRNVQ